jgi:hypothetical protein
MRVASHTLPIWSTQRMWKLLVQLLVIAVLPSRWWTWRVEGLLVLQLLLLVVVVIVFTSIIGKLVLICLWQSSLQGIKLINDFRNGAFHPLKSCVGGLLVLREEIGHPLHHSVNIFVANAFFFFVSRCWWWWWWLLSLFWWHGEQKTERNTTSYGLAKIKCKTNGGNTHSLKHLTTFLRLFYLHYR